MSEPKDIKQESELVTAIVTTAIPDFVEEVKDPRKDQNLDYKRFGSNNLFPQALATLYRKSIPLRSIINSIVTFTVSGGFIVEEGNTEGQEFIDAPNNKGESLDDVFNNYMVDRKLIGNAWLQIVTDKDRTFVNVSQTQSLYCRLSREGDKVLIHPNWENYRKTDGLTTIIPLYPNFTTDSKGVHRSMFHVLDYEPDFDWYGVPSYIAALDAAAIGYKTNKWNVSRLDNAFQSSGVLVIDGKMSDDDAKALKTEFTKEMVGEGNQGKVLMIIKKLGGEGTDFTPINNNTDGDWTQLHTQSNEDLILSLGWKKSLVGMSETTGFDTDRVLNDYQIVLSTAITKDQRIFTKIITKITKEVAGIELKGLAINNVSPINLLTKLTADKYTFKYEARKWAGLEFDPEDPIQNVYIDESNGTTTEEATANTITSNIKAMFKKYIK